MSDPLTRRRILGASAWSAPVILASATVPVYAASLSPNALAPNQSVNEVIDRLGPKVDAQLNFTPGSPVESGASWTQALILGAKGSLPGYQLAVVSNTAGTGLNLVISKVEGSKKTWVSSTPLNVPISGQPIELKASYDGSTVMGQVYSNGVLLGQLKLEDITLDGVQTIHHQYLTGTKPIDFSPTAFTNSPVLQYDQNYQGSLDHEGFNLIVNDEFDQPSIDTSVWNVRDSGNFLQTGVTGPGSQNWPSISNGSSAIDQKENVVLTGSSVQLWIKKSETSQISPYTSGWSVGKTFDHTAGYLDSKGKLEQRYGRWEVRAKNPVGPNRAVWGAFWLIAANSNTPGRYLEFDLNEGFGRNETGVANNLPSHNRVMTSIHMADIGTPEASASDTAKRSVWTPLGTDDFENEWHTYALEITPEGVQFFLDGQPYFGLKVSESPALAQRLADPATLFNMRLNIMTGNRYWNHADTAEEIAQPLEVDYVRVWSYDG